MAGPNFSTDLLGTLLYRVFFGFQIQTGDPHMGATIATVMFLIILAGVMIYLLGVQRRMHALPVLRSAGHERSPVAICSARPRPT